MPQAFHMVFLDGAYQTVGAAAPVFRPVSAPESSDLGAVGRADRRTHWTCAGTSRPGRARPRECLARRRVNAALPLSRSGKKAEAVALLNGQETLPEKLGVDLEAHRAYNEQLGKQGAADALDIRARVVKVGIALAVAAIILIGTVGYLIFRQLTRQLGGEPDYAAEVMQSIANGELSMDFRLRRNDSSSLLAAVKSMVEKLKLVVAGQRRVIDAANHGDFTERVELEGLAGFQKDLGSGLNDLVITA